MKKKLVFHLYCDKNWEDNAALKLHFECLSYYAHVFDEILIVIATDFYEDEKFILKMKLKLIKIIKCDCLALKVVPNTVYREAKTFYDEVLNSNENMVFFGHTKGYANMSNPKFNKESVFSWIMGLYWLSLEFAEEAERCLSLNTQYSNGMFFGSFLSYTKDLDVHPCAYPGTFFWVNPNRLKKNMASKEGEFPILSDRMCAEEFPGVVCEILNDNCARGHNSYGIFPEAFNFYYNKNDVIDAVSLICSRSNNNEANEFLEFSEKMSNLALRHFTK